MENKLVTIVIPVLNEEKNLPYLFESIVKQSHRPIEIIFVDGGSTDGTIDLINEFAKKYSSEDFIIKLLKEEEFGPLRSPANARNIGIINSSSDYIILLDADSILLDVDFVAKVSKALENCEWVSIKLIPVGPKGTLIEKAQIMIEKAWLKEYGYYVDDRHALRKSALTRLFDAGLGVNEDYEFFEKYLREKMGKRPCFVDTMLGTMVPATLNRFIKRYLWYGRTAPLFYLKIHKNLTKVFKAIYDNRGMLFSPLILLGAFILIPFDHILSLLLFILYLYLRIRFFFKIPRKYRSLKLFTVASTLQLIAALSYLYGFTYGLLRIIMKSNVKVSRD